jgi:hypothetical protein
MPMPASLAPDEGADVLGEIVERDVRGFWLLTCVVALTGSSVDSTDFLCACNSACALWCTAEGFS